MPITRRTFLMALGIAPAVLANKESVASTVLKGKDTPLPFPHFYAGGMMKEGKVIKNYLCSSSSPYLQIEVPADAMGLAASLNQIVNQVVFGGQAGGSMVDTFSTDCSASSITVAEIEEAVKKFWMENPRTIEETTTFTMRQYLFLKHKLELDDSWRQMVDKIRFGRFQPVLATHLPKEHQKAQESVFSRDLGMEIQS